MEIRYFLIAIFLVFLTVPALAGTLYISDGPTFTATVAGTNQFLPGTDLQLPVKIENRGLNNLKFVQTGYIERDDLPNTAKFVTATLTPGDSPVIIKSDSQVVGDLPGGKSTQVIYSLKIPKQAAAGEYLIPLTIRYQYLAGAEQSAGDLIEYRYETKSVTISLPLTIEPNVVLDVSPVSNGGLNVGTEGYLELNITNSGGEDAHAVVIKIVRNGNSPITPTDSNVYIGDFPAGNTTVCRFKVSVSRDAEAQEYPVDIIAVYKNHEGDTITSVPATVGIPVHGKIGFDVVAADSKMSAGKKKVIEVTYRNSGDATAYSAQARVSVVDPFTSNDDSAFLGDIAPGKTAVARYEVGVSSGAVAKDYALDSEVRYRDSLDNSQISDTVKVPVTVVEATAMDGVMANLVFVIVGIVVVIAAGYYLVVIRKKK
jgi:hypothetical protein